MLASLEKLVAVLGTPLAVIYAIGHLAQVVNLWLVEKVHDFSFLTAWHVVSVIDRAVVVGIGLKYLVFALPVALVILWVLTRLLQRSEWTDGFGIVGKLRQGLQATTNGQDHKTLADWWIWLVFTSFVVGVLTVFIWLPLHAALPPENDQVMKYLPHANITVAADPEADPSNVGINGQIDTGLTNPSYSTTQLGQTIEDEVVEGVLLSHDEQYWYVLSEKEPNAGQVAIVPVGRVSEIRVAPER